MATLDPLDEILTPKQVSEELKIPMGSLEQHRYRGTGPKFIKIGARVFYRRSDLRTYLDERTAQRTGDVPVSSRD
jgi:predicted DNA-binding transcriptional regulator AlpA